jgi:predicted RNase H-like nuclease (RuvC/YqgF family)
LQKKLQENTNESNSLKQNYKEVQEEKKQSILKKHELESDIKRLEKELVNSRNEISQTEKQLNKLTNKKQFLMQQKDNSIK